MNNNHENIIDMASKRKSLETTKGRRAKPLVSKGGITRSRTPYKCGGKTKTK